MDDRFGFEQVDVSWNGEPIQGRPRAVTLRGGPRDGEVVVDGASDYVEITCFGDEDRTATWAPDESQRIPLH